MYLAFIARLVDKEGSIKISVNKDEQIFEMKKWPETFWSEVGYNDPKSLMDIDKVENYRGR